jgi:hypothetical protein
LFPGTNQIVKMYHITQREMNTTYGVSDYFEDHILEDFEWE